MVAVVVVGADSRNLVALFVTTLDELLDGRSILVCIHIAANEDRAFVLCFKDFSFGHNKPCLGGAGVV